MMSKHHCQVMFLMLPLLRLIHYLPLFPVLLFHSHPMLSQVSQTRMDQTLKIQFHFPIHRAQHLLRLTLTMKRKCPLILLLTA